MNTVPKCKHNKTSRCRMRWSTDAVEMVSKDIVIVVILIIILLIIIIGCSICSKCRTSIWTAADDVHECCFDSFGRGHTVVLFLCNWQRWCCCSLILHYFTATSTSTVRHKMRRCHRLLTFFLVWCKEEDEEASGGIYKNKRNALYCIVFIHFYSTSGSLSLSEALPTTAIDTVSEFTRRSATGNCR